MRGERQARDDLRILEDLSIEIRYEAPDDGDEAEVGGELELEEVRLPLAAAAELKASVRGSDGGDSIYSW
jgi:hypothetical protein